MFLLQILEFRQVLSKGKKRKMLDEVRASFQDKN